MLGQGVLCAVCKRARATQLDHDPPLSVHRHREGTRCCRLVPVCAECNHAGGTLVRTGEWRPGLVVLGVELEPERQGLAQADRRWRVPWLRGLRTPPPDAVWPRLMTIPHPAATGSYGREFIRWAEQRSLRDLRWWQRLVAVRLLEHDTDGRLVWETLVLSTARQVGKSWLLRELMLWRIHQGDRFGEPQDVLHTGKDLAVCKEIQRPARVWAKARTQVYKVREVNGQEEIEYLADGSRWMLRAKEAVYGYSVSLGVADEAWKVRASSIEEGLTPTMAEREQPQLLLVSTAHRLATSLMLGRRQVALADLEVGDGDLLIEWSAPEHSQLDDVNGWRLASPHWSPHRQRLIGKRLDAMRAGEVEDPEEPDPEASFRAQWLNQWPRKLTEPTGNTEPLLPAGLWLELAEPDLDSTGPIWVALEDDYGLGAAVAACCRLPDGRLELDAWKCDDWDHAVHDAQALGESRWVNEYIVGASLYDRLPPELQPVPAAGKETRAGLALLRDLAMTQGVTHDATTYQLDDAIAEAMVREAPTGLYLVSRGDTHLVKAAVWALAAAHRLETIPVVH
jgi:hypothetical protein